MVLIKGHVEVIVCSFVVFGCCISMPPKDVIEEAMDSWICLSGVEYVSSLLAPLAVLCLSSIWGAKNIELGMQMRCTRRMSFRCSVLEKRSGISSGSIERTISKASENSSRSKKTLRRYARLDVPTLIFYSVLFSRRFFLSRESFRGVSFSMWRFGRNITVI